MRITREHQQTSGGILTPVIRYTERPCLCHDCNRTGRLRSVLARLRNAFNVAGRLRARQLRRGGPFRI